MNLKGLLVAVAMVGSMAAVGCSAADAPSKQASQVSSDASDASDATNFVVVRTTWYRPVARPVYVARPYWRFRYAAPVVRVPVVRPGSVVVRTPVAVRPHVATPRARVDLGITLR